MGLFSKFKKNEKDPLGLTSNLGLPKEKDQFGQGISDQFGQQNPQGQQGQQFGYPGQQDQMSRQFGMPQQYPQYLQQGASSYPSSFQDNSSYMISKNIELVSAKLDSIQIALQNLNQRIANLEMRIKERGW